MVSSASFSFYPFLMVLLVNITKKTTINNKTSTETDGHWKISMVVLRSMLIVWKFLAKHNRFYLVGLVILFFLFFL